MASILDEYEDSLSRSAVLQPGCPSVGIPHSGKGREGALSALPAPAGAEWGGWLPERGFASWACGLGLGPWVSAGSLGGGRSLKEQQEQPRDLGPASGVLLRGNWDPDKEVTCLRAAVGRTENRLQDPSEPVLFSRVFPEVGGRKWGKKLVKGGCCRRRDGPRADFVPEQGKMKHFRPLLELGEAWH